MAAKPTWTWDGLDLIALGVAAAIIWGGWQFPRPVGLFAAMVAILAGFAITRWRRRRAQEVEQEELARQELWRSTYCFSHRIGTGYTSVTWQADLDAMRLSLHHGEHKWLMSDDSVPYSLSVDEHGTLRMRIDVDDETRQIVVHNLEAQLSDPHRQPANITAHFAKIARIKAREWEPLPEAISVALNEQFRRLRDKGTKPSS